MARALQISVFMPNHPGELLRMCGRLRDGGVNILAMSIQNARDYVNELFRARERTGRRMVLAESYRGVLRESAEYSVVRFVADAPDRAQDALAADDAFFVTVDPVICLRLEHKPGALEDVARRFSEHGINIDYVYGSALPEDPRSLFVCHVPDVERGLALFGPAD